MRMNGPVWKDNYGVTGERNFRTETPNYVTTRDAEGKTVTLTGDAADRFRELSRR